MLFPILLTGLVQSSAATPLSAVDVPAVFAAACIDGEAKLSATDVTKIGFDALPAELKSRLGQPVSGDVWRLNSGGSAYLYMLNYPDQQHINPKICGVASDAVDVESGASMLERRFGGSDLRTQVRAMEWLRPQDGYVAVATKAARFGVLQINWLSTADRARLVEKTSSLPK